MAIATIDVPQLSRKPGPVHSVVEHSLPTPYIQWYAHSLPSFRSGYLMPHLAGFEAAGGYGFASQWVRSVKLRDG